MHNIQTIPFLSPKAWQTIKILIELTKRDFMDRYFGSVLGIAWAFLQPTINALVFWFVYQVGFKPIPINDMPFILWLMPGMFSWFFISESIGNATSSIIDNSYLVKKVVFRVELLPIVKLLSSAYIHIFLILFLCCIFMIYGYSPNWYYLQLVYYLFAAFILVWGITLITSSINVFIRDVGQVVMMIIQFLFWITPVFWSIQSAPEGFRKFLMLNPFYYITEGYRNALVFHKWFWEAPGLTIYFWGVTIFICIVGVILFKRLKPHFADVI